MSTIVIRMLIGGLAALALAGAATAAEKWSPGKSTDPSAVCAEMMAPAGRGGEDGKPMGELMPSAGAPRAMANMMAMARRMGQGDAMLGMTRMMEMMSSTSDDARMGGRGGLMPPGDAHPGK
jgi:hypothetical protein